MAKKFLQQVLSLHFIKFSLIPILIVEVLLLLLYFSINAYISTKNTNLLLQEAQSHAKDILSNEAEIIEDKLNEVSMMATFLQNEHQAIFKNPNNFGLPNGKPDFEIAPNGVFYKTNKVGSSVYYSSHTKIDEKARKKATFTEAMDISFKSITEINPIIVATYFNSWDNMNRLYPFIDKVYEQYGSHIVMKDYNFYYLADLKHNPEKKPVWTGAYLDPAGNGWMLSCVVPIYNNDFLEGVTGLDITIDSFVKNILSTKLSYNAKLFMINKSGMIIAMSEKIENLLGLKELKEHLYTDKILKTIEKPEEFNILKNKSPFASHFKNLIENNLESDSLKIQDTEYLTLQESVKETDWKLMVLIDKKEIFSSIEKLKDLSNQIGYLAIAFLLLFYVIFFYMLLKKINKFSRVITEPIIKLSNQTSEIKSTDSKIELIQTDIKEIYQLNQNFTSMMNELNDSTRKLYEAKEVAEELARAKDDFLANMSHELKTPLNSINVISELMQNNSKNLDEKQIKSLDIINKCGKDLLFLINDVLDLSKLEAGQIELDYATLDIKQLMGTINDMFTSQAEKKGVILEFSVDENLNVIYSDETRIKQIIKNLLSNAIKFTPKDKKIYFRVEDEGKFIKAIVEDEGIGIAEDKLEHIFDRFKQADTSTTRQYGGTGLGLAICKDLLKLLKGEMSVSSTIEKGSRFEVLIPKNKEKIDDISKKSIDLKDTSNKSTDKKEKILIYNNDPISFMYHIMEIKKHFDTYFSTILDEVIEKYKTEPSKVLIEEKNLSQIDFDKIKNNISKDDLIVIVADNKESQLIDFSKKTIKKSFNIEQLY